jgi:Xaa-Pro aminopeptidase
VTVNELPRLVPYDETPIRPGMVFSVEPGAYQGPDGTFGARSEKMVLVTDSGPDILSTFSWGI